MQHKVCITGMGAVSPIGHSAEQSFQAAVNGVLGIDYATIFDRERTGIHVAGEVKNLDMTGYITGREAKRMARFTQFAIVAALQAWNQSKMGILRLRPPARRRDHGQRHGRHRHHLRAAFRIDPQRPEKRFRPVYPQGHHQHHTRTDRDAAKPARPLLQRCGRPARRALMRSGRRITPSRKGAWTRCW